MRRAVSTYCFVRKRLHPGLLDQLASAGAETFELFCARSHFDYQDREHVKEIAGWFRGNSRELHSMHSPMYFGMEFERAGQPSVNIVNREKRARVEAMDEIKRAIEVAELLPFSFLVQHVGDSNEAFDPYKFDNAMTAIEHLKAFAKPLGVTVLVENIPNELSTPDKLVELIRTGHFGDVGVCFDTGHAHLDGGVEAAVDTLRPLIRSTHVHDNGGEKDDHLLPGEGTIDWKKTVELLGAAPQRPPLLLEIKGSDEMAVAQRVSESFERLL